MMTNVQSDGHKRLQLSRLSANGVAVEELLLSFVLPGYPNIELKPSGAGIGVTLDNLGEYLQVGL